MPIIAPVTREECLSAAVWMILGGAPTNKALSFASMTLEKPLVKSTLFRHLRNERQSREKQTNGKSKKRKRSSEGANKESNSENAPSQPSSKRSRSVVHKQALCYITDIGLKISDGGIHYPEINKVGKHSPEQKMQQARANIRMTEIYKVAFHEAQLKYNESRQQKSKTTPAQICRDTENKWGLPAGSIHAKRIVNYYSLTQGKLTIDPKSRGRHISSLQQALLQWMVSAFEIDIHRGCRFEISDITRTLQRYFEAANMPCSSKYHLWTKLRDTYPEVWDFAKPRFVKNRLRESWVTEDNLLRWHIAYVLPQINAL